MYYTTIKNIRRRLQGRLNVRDYNNLIPGAASKEVDNELIDQVGNQIEARLNLALAQIYLLPIPPEAEYAFLVLESIVEKLVVSELATVHFQQTQSPELGGDAGFGAILRKQAIEELEAILHGHGVFIPGITQPPSEGTYRQPLLLPGVRLIPEAQQPDTFTRSYSFVAQKKIPETEKIEWESS